MRRFEVRPYRKSKFPNGYDGTRMKASVSRPLVFEPEKFAYDPELSPLFLDRKVQGVRREVQERLLVCELDRYADFTKDLEDGPVRDGCILAASEDMLPFEMSGTIRQDARQILDDEIIHGDEAVRLMDQLHRWNDLPAIDFPSHEFMRAVGRLRDAEEEPILKKVVSLIAAAVTETLITVNLRKLPMSTTTVHPAVTEYVARHAHDERFHNAVFREVFKRTWSWLSRSRWKHEIPRIAKMIAEMLVSYLSPDREAYTRILNEFPDEFPNPDEIIDDVLRHAFVKERIRDSSASTVRMLRECDIFEDDEVMRVFGQSGLL